MTTTTIKAYDTAITFTSTLETNGVAQNLTGATVQFILKRSATVFSAAATIVSATAGTVRYSPGGGFPTTVGTYKQEWEVTFGDSTILTFPSSSYNEVVIIADLDAG